MKIKFWELYLTTQNTGVVFTMFDAQWLCYMTQASHHDVTLKDTERTVLFTMGDSDSDSWITYPSCEWEDLWEQDVEVKECLGLVIGFKGHINEREILSRANELTAENEREPE